jgi:hypothetical protein
VQAKQLFSSCVIASQVHSTQRPARLHNCASDVEGCSLLLLLPQLLQLLEPSSNVVSSCAGAPLTVLGPPLT